MFLLRFYSQKDFDLISSSFINLKRYVLSENYHGYDPFDALTSPIFSIPVFQTTRLFKLISQQLLKRLPINIRPLLRIKKGCNPVTFGLALQAINNIIITFPENNKQLLAEGNRLIDEIKVNCSKGYSGACWGYDFEWQARYASIPAYCPTIVATGFITNSLFNYHETTKNPIAFELCKSATQFLLKDLNRTYEKDTFCFSYSPNDKQVVYNATLKGARLLSQVYSVTKEINLLEEGDRTVRFVIKNQNDDGSWSYSRGDTRNWVDNFHTGFILDCLDEFIRKTNKNEYRVNLEKGVKYYIDNLFNENGVPKYYSNVQFPLDTTAAAQSILTLLRFGFDSKALLVALYMIKNMQHPSGYFYYKKNIYWKNKISYMRWSNAIMYVALSALIRSMKK